MKLGITYASEFAYLADGCNGLRVLQLTSPETPGNYGFSPRPTPQLIATYPIPKGGRALAISKGVDRDRAVALISAELGVTLGVQQLVGPKSLHARRPGLGGLFRQVVFFGHLLADRGKLRGQSVVLPEKGCF